MLPTWNEPYGSPSLRICLKREPGKREVFSRVDQWKCENCTHVHEKMCRTQTTTFSIRTRQSTDCFYENTHLPVSAYQFGLSRVVRFQRHCFFPFFSNAAAAPIFTGIAREKGKAQGHTLEMKFKKKKSCRFLKNPFKIRYIQLHANSCWANCLLTGVSGVMLNWLWLEKCLNLISNYFSGSHFFKIVFKIDHWFFDCLSIYQSYKTYTKRHVTKRNEKRNTIFTNNHLRIIFYE